MSWNMGSLRTEPRSQDNFPNQPWKTTLPFPVPSPHLTCPHSRAMVLTCNYVTYGQENASSTPGSHSIRELSFTEETEEQAGPPESFSDRTAIERRSIYTRGRAHQLFP